jgi:DNA topoisomerase VI subunit B
LAGLIEVHGGQIVLTEAGVAYGGLVLKEKEMGGADKI